MFKNYKCAWCSKKAEKHYHWALKDVESGQDRHFCSVLCLHKWTVNELKEKDVKLGLESIE